MLFASCKMPWEHGQCFKGSSGFLQILVIFQGAHEQLSYLDSRMSMKDEVIQNTGLEQVDVIRLAVRCSVDLCASYRIYFCIHSGIELH